MLDACSVALAFALAAATPESPPPVPTYAPPPAVVAQPAPAPSPAAPPPPGRAASPSAPPRDDPESAEPPAPAPPPAEQPPAPAPHRASPASPAPSGPSASTSSAPRPSQPVATATPPTPEGRTERFRVEDEDIDPSIVVVESKEVSVRLGALVQVHLVPWLGDDALLDNGDVASDAGFRLRRARLGVEARLRSQLGLFLSLNPLESDQEVGSVADAKLFWDGRSWLNVSAGTSKVPLSRAALTSSRRLLGIERPLAVTALTPERRLGVSAEGLLWGGRLAYLGSVMNGTQGFGEGNQFGGVLYGGRLEASPFGRIEPFDRHRSGVSVGVSALRETNSALTTFAWSADLLAVFRGGSLAVEVLCDRRAPGETPDVSPELSDTLRRCGGYVEAGWFLPIHQAGVQLTARAERYDDNRDLDDSGDTQLFSGGVNVDVVPDRARAQLQFIKRLERFGPERDNDALVLALQGAF